MSTCKVSSILCLGHGPSYIEPGRGRPVVLICCNKICTPSTPTLQLGKCPADLFRGGRENGTHFSRATEKWVCDHLARSIVLRLCPLFSPLLKWAVSEINFCRLQNRCRMQLLDTGPHFLDYISTYLFSIQQSVLNTCTLTSGNFPTDIIASEMGKITC